MCGAEKEGACSLLRWWAGHCCLLSVLPARGSGRCAVPVAADAALFALPPSSSALLAQQGLRTPLLPGRSVLFLSCQCLCPVCSLSLLSSSVHTGEREKQKHFLLLSALLSPCQASEFLWALSGVTPPSASLGRSPACLPLWLAGVFGRGGLGGKPCKKEGRSHWWCRSVP